MAFILMTLVCVLACIAFGSMTLSESKRLNAFKALKLNIAAAIGVGDTDKLREEYSRKRLKKNIVLICLISAATVFVLFIILTAVKAIPVTALIFILFLDAFVLVLLNYISLKRESVKVCGKQKINWRSYIPLWLIMLPGIAYLFVNNILPLYGLTIAFRRLDYSLGILNSPFYGFGELSDYSFFHNFSLLFESGLLWKLLKTTLSYNLVFLVLDIVVPVAVAILFNEIRRKVPKKIFQTLILFPNVISWVIVSYIVFGFLGTANGFINNSILKPLTGSSINFYAEPKYWPFILTFVHLWKGIGFGMIVYLATILGIDPSLYEAAKIDGGGWWKRTWSITLPSLKKMIITMFILNLSKVVVSDFGLFYQVTKNTGALYDTTQTLDVFVYNTLITNPDIASSSAVSVFQSLVGFVLVITANLIIRKIDRDSALF